MTKEEIIHRLQYARHRIDNITFAPDVLKAIDIAIEAVSNTDADTISRAKAIEAINKALDRQTLLNRFVRKVAIDAIKQLPPAQPAQPERIKGHWIEHDDGLTACECSVCHEKYALYEEDVFGRNFCPNCGAEMEVTA